ncbi:STAS domain-containing protein [Nonomuraea fuscirosea]|uniref:STAS domain-containing protein n=1 Tax=Nonomuraea fuscirosea TaxID=1291556 RepID=UPI002DDAA9F3|nr:STAS domain-containing protein [Nonomuraea fuscirosea]WSA56082.1 STAS domain-containing protein [Nonomuraea fuscirosea]
MTDNEHSGQTESPPDAPPQPANSPSDDFSVRVRIRGDVLLIELKGLLAGPSVDMLQMYVVSTLATHVSPKVIMDIGGVTLMDEAGLGVLRTATYRAREAGGRLVIAGGHRLLDADVHGLERAATISDAFSGLNASGGTASS